VDRLQRLFPLFRLRREERTRRREIADECLRARLLQRLDDGAAHLTEPRLPRELLVPVGLVARVADQLSELTLQGVALVPPVPEQDQAATGLDDPVQLGQGARAIEPVEGLAGEGSLHIRIGKRDRFRWPFERLRLGHGHPELREHRRSRLDRHDLEAERDKAAGQLPCPRSHVEDARARREPELLGRPAQRLLGVLRTVPLILSRHRLEAARAVRHDSPGRGR
jgi:hypothetical protein